MPLIRLECSDSPPTERQCQSLEAARDRFVAAHAVDFTDDANLCPRLPPQLSFFALPEQLLLAYEKHRESSELGRVFRIANGLHDFIDAVVMVGATLGRSGAGISAAQAIARACCDPFHNELSRAARGSKPRLYFCGNDLDNDYLQSLITRLSSGGYSDSTAEDYWAIIATDDPTRSQASQVFLEHLVQTLRQSPQPGCEERSARLMTTIGRKDNHTLQRMSVLGFDQELRIPDEIERVFSPLTPLGLLPSAFLGLDCIQLLVGAAAINENFRDASFSENLVLRYVAANQPLSPDEVTQHDRSNVRKAMAIWSPSLLGFRSWLETLTAKRGENPLSVINLANLDPLETRGVDVCNHLVVDTIRTDPLSVIPGGASIDQAPSVTLPQMQLDSISASQRMLAESGIRQTTTSLPVIDTHSLGQWLQFMMLTSAIESAELPGLADA